MWEEKDSDFHRIARLALPYRTGIMGERLDVRLYNRLQPYIAACVFHI